MNAKKIVLGLSYLYIGLPIGLFFLEWTKWWIGIPVCILAVYSLYKAVNNETELWLPELNKETVQLGIFVVGLIALWVYFSGIGGRVAQTGDQSSRNTIFEILVNYNWPVHREVLIDGVTHDRALVYYVGFWLPAAAVGKVFGLAAGYSFQMIWAILGIALVYVYITSFLKRFSSLPLIGLILFGGLDYLGYFLTGYDMSSMVFTKHLEHWNELYQYSGMTTQLYWVFNQAIYAWILVCLILVQKNNRQMILIWGCGLLSASLPFVGLIPFMLYKIIDNGIRIYREKSGKIKAIFKDLFTIENVLCGGCVGIMSFLYCIGNEVLTNTGLALNDWNHTYAIKNSGSYGVLGMIVNAATTPVYDPEVLAKQFWYIMLILLEFGVYSILIYRYQRNSTLFYVTMVTLLLVPMIEFGGANEFCMRVSIPALFVLYVLVVQAWYKSIENKDWIRVIVLLMVFAIGARTPIGEFTRAVSDTTTRVHLEDGLEMLYQDEEDIFRYGNFSGEKEDNIFFKYLAQ